MQISLIRRRATRLDAAVHRWLVANSIDALRISVGAVFLGFGVLKYFPGVSPAEGLARRTTDILTFGLVPGHVAMIVVATLECAIGSCLILGRWMRVALYLLVGEFVGILSPIILLPGRLFAGPHHAPTLEGQYVLKDVILVAAAMVVATTLRGGRIVPGAASARPTHRDLGTEPFTAAEKLDIVLVGVRGERSVRSICRLHNITESDYRRWRDEMLDGATLAMQTATD